MKKIKLVIVAILLAAFLPLVIVHAQDDNSVVEPKTSSKVCPANTTCLDNPLGSVDSPAGIINNVLTGILGIVGSLALLMFIYGGFTWMLAGGNAENVKKGRDILVWAAIGLVVIFTSYAMVDFVIKTIKR